VDERNYDLFDNYKCIPQNYNNFSFNGDTEVEGPIFGTAVHPMLCFYSKTTSGSTTTYTINPSPMSFYASHFKWWTGSINFLFMLNMNKFCSCRVRVSWLPYLGDSTTIVLQDTPNTYSQIYDCNGDTVIKFSIPYLKQIPHSLVPTFIEADLLDTNLDSFANGQIVMSLVTPLIATQNVADSTVYVNVWVAAGGDMHCTQPISYPGYSYVTTAMQTQGMDTDDYSNMRETFAQQFEGLANYRVTQQLNVNFGETHPYKWSSLLHRPTYYDTYVVGAVGYGTILDLNMDYDTLGPWSRIRRAFLCNRGSYRLKSPDVNQASDLPVARINPVPNSIYLPFYKLEASEGYAFGNLLTDGGGVPNTLEIQVPYFTNAYYNMLSTAGADGIPSGATSGTTCVIEDFLGDGGYSCTLFVSAADDFSFGWPLNPPTMYMQYVATEKTKTNKKDSDEKPNRMNTKKQIKKRVKQLKD